MSQSLIKQGQRIANKIQYRSLLLAKEIVQGLQAKSYRLEDTQTIFVAGVQRSGTNMMMDVLERSFETVVYHERDQRAFDAYQMRSTDVIHGLIASSSAKHVVIKALCELQDLHRLLSEFAPARAAWVLRNYEDVVNSHLALWTGMPRNIGLIVNNRNSAGWRGQGMSNATHNLIRKLYHPDITNASACALFWYFRNILFFEQGFDKDHRVYPIKYESLVKDPQNQFQRLFDFLGIQYTQWISRKVFASSVSKRRAPQIDPPIRMICNSLMQRFEELCPRE